MRSRLAAAAAFIALFAGAGLVLPATAAAATSRLAINVPRLEGACMFFKAPANETLTLKWKAAGGALKENASIPTTTAGDPLYCSTSNIVQVGDKLVVSDSSGSHTLTVPSLTAQINRVTDTMSGHGPASTTLRIECGGSPYGQFEPCQYTKNVTTNGSGSWNKHIPFDLFGGFTMDVRWNNTFGDIVYRQVTTPYFRVFLGQARFSGVGSPDSQPSVLLEDSSSNQKGIDMTTAGPDGSFSGVLRDGSHHKVTVAPGDTAISDIAGDASFVVPQISATATASDDRVVGQCELTGSYTGIFVEVFRHGHRVGAGSSGETDGSFDIDFSNAFPDSANIKVGDKLFVECLQGSRDQVVKVIFAQ